MFCSVETKADILSSNSFSFFLLLLQLHLELNPVSRLLLYFEGANSKHSGLCCGSLSGPQTYCFLLLLVIPTLSHKYLAAIVDICFENEQIFIYWKSLDNNQVIFTLMPISTFSKRCR